MIVDSNTFWNGVTYKGNGLSSFEEKKEFCEYLIKRIITSPEYSKIYFNTQVYNEIKNDVTTRGLHSKGVAIVAKWIAYKAAIDAGKSEKEAEVSGLLAEILGYLHDLGHSPFGHDGEDALDNENKRFPADSDDLKYFKYLEYKRNRRKLYGDKYEEECKDPTPGKMSYSHNEISATIGSDMILRFAEEGGYNISEKAIPYIKTGILSHSTSKVSKEPDGIEQKAVRIADKIAYVPQDLLDLIKQSVISIEDLSSQEKGLLGLNENQLTKREKESILESLKSNEDISDDVRNQAIAILEKYELTEEDKKKLLMVLGKNKKIFYIIIKGKTKYIKDLRRISKMSEDEKIKLFKELDSKVGEIQVEIGEKCVQLLSNGKVEIGNMKDRVDIYRNYVNKNKTDGFSIPEVFGIKYFINFRNAQLGRKNPKKTGDGIVYEDIPKELKKKEIDLTSEIFREHLIEKLNLDPMLATLWVAKTKYQDAFINGELTRTIKDKDGTEREETLADINQRNEKKWMIKTTFQFFYTYIDLIPKEFCEKNKERYTKEQMVSAFIASFTNNGLEEVYNRLVEKGLIVPREKVIEKLSEYKIDGEKSLMDCLEAIISKFNNNSNANAKEKIPENDILEFFYEEFVGEKIVKGKNQRVENKIPIVPDANIIIDKLDEQTDGKFLSSKKQPLLLSSAINLSTQEIVFNDIETAIASIIARQGDIIKEKSEQLSREEKRE